MKGPRLAPHVRLAYDKSRGRQVLLAPESVTTLNDTGAAIARLCDGDHPVEAIVAELRERYSGVRAEDVESFLGKLSDLRCLKKGES
jgi:pyrroloquinoline quinone biosynthesis protein D